MATRPVDVSLRSSMPAVPAASTVDRPPSRERMIGRLRRAWDLAPPPSGYVDFDAAATLSVRSATSMLDAAGDREVADISLVEFIDHDVLETCRQRVSPR